MLCDFTLVKQPDGKILLGGTTGGLNRRLCYIGNRPLWDEPKFVKVPSAN
jgi:hypothetical protein